MKASALGIALVLGVLVSASCGQLTQEKAGSTTSTTTEKSATDVKLRLIAKSDSIGGCIYEHPGGTGKQVTATDAAGAVVGVGEWQGTPGTKSCDWTVTFPTLPTSSAFLAFSAKGFISREPVTIKTFPSAEIKSGVTLTVETGPMG